MNSLISLPSKSIASILIILFIIFPVPGLADETPSDTNGDAAIEQVEEDLVEQGLLEDPEKEATEEEDSEDKAQESLSKSATMESDAPMMATMEDPTPVSLEDSIFGTGAHMAIPDISMKIGAAVLEYPIQVPMGRNGLSPSVVLNYNSSRKNSLAGVGWDLNIDSIQRSMKRGACYNCNEFTYNGKDLVPVNADSSGYGKYRPEKEQAFSIIEFNPDNSWAVTLKNGMVYHFGASSDSRQTNSHGTFQWLLTTVMDTNGNTLTYTYSVDQGQVYLSAIDYIDYYNLSFYYEDRPDAITSYGSKSKVVTAKRLKTIALTSLDGNIRAYDLAYEQSTNTAQSLLTRIPNMVPIFCWTATTRLCPDHPCPLPS